MDGTTDGEVAQKTVGPSKCDVNTLTVHLLGSHVFFVTYSVTLKKILKQFYYSVWFGMANAQ